MEKSFVLSVGGSLIVPPGGIDIQFLKKFRAFIIDQVKRGYKFYLVIGGGTTARTYINAALKTTKIDTDSRDWVGISATRLNAQLVKVIFGSLANPEIIIDPVKLVKANRKITIVAGYKPGWSTDYCAVLLAKNNGIKTVINLSNIDYAYTKDPKKYKEAKRLVKTTWPEFRKVVGNVWKPGLNVPFDPVASRAAARGKMQVIILNGQNLKNLGQALAGLDFTGTTIN